MYTQIRAYHNKEVAFEVRFNTAYMGKILFHFWEYGEKSKKWKKEDQYIDCFLNIEDTHDFINGIKTGKIQKILKTEFYNKGNIPMRKIPDGKGGEREVDYAYLNQGGSTVGQLKLKNKSRPDGMAEARHLKIKPSSKEGNVMLVAEKGPGKTRESGYGKGLITMVNKERYIQVAITQEDLYELATAIEKTLLAIEVVKMMSYADTAGLQSILTAEDIESRNYLEQSRLEGRGKDKRIVSNRDLLLNLNDKLDEVLTLSKKVDRLEKMITKIGKTVVEPPNVSQQQSLITPNPNTLNHPEPTSDKKESSQSNHHSIPIEGGFPPALNENDDLPF